MCHKNFILSPSPTLTLAYINVRGQTGLNHAKQSQLESFIRIYKPDILHLQEINVTSDAFENCHFINSNYNLDKERGLQVFEPISTGKYMVETDKGSEGRVSVIKQSLWRDWCLSDCHGTKFMASLEVK